MASRYQFAQLKNRIFAGAFVCILFCLFAPAAPVYAHDIPNTLPDLGTFIEIIKDGNASRLRGVYIPSVMALAVVQQPAGQPAYVSSKKSVVTQFNMAAEAGNVGLLAHNTLAGRFFSKIKQGDRIILIYGDGRIESFMTQSIQRYQALKPLSPYSPFVDIGSQKSLSAEALFNKVYRGKHHLTLQTCIESNHNPSWGRLFVLATPIKNETINYLVYNHPTLKGNQSMENYMQKSESRREEINFSPSGIRLRSAFLMAGY